MLRPPPIMRDLTAAELEHFRQYGFVRVKGAIAEEEIARLQAGMSVAVDTFELSSAGCDLTAFAESAVSYAATGTSGRMTAQAGPLCTASLGDALRRSGKRPLKEQTSIKQKGGRSLMDAFVSTRVRELRELALDSDLPRMAAAFLDVPSVRLYDDILCVKEPGAIERSAFHQDISYMHVGGDRGCTLWIFVDPVRDGAGALGYVPSSHKWGQIFKPNFLLSELTCPGAEGAELPDIDTAPDAFGVQYVDADPGDIIVHHVLTVCGKQGNRGAKPCRGFGLRYVDASLPFHRRAGVGLPPVYEHAVAEGSALDEAHHPIAWPQQS